MRLIERMPSLYRQQLQLPLREKISKSMRHRWSISCIKTMLQISVDKELASVSELAPSETRNQPLPRALELAPAGCRHAGVPPLPQAACAMPACRLCPRWQAPPHVMVVNAWCGGDDVNHRPVGNPKRKV
jgi:hypothetical protein